MKYTDREFDQPEGCRAELHDQGAARRPCGLVAMAEDRSDWGGPEMSGLE